jgi:hypothetical protein
MNPQNDIDALETIYTTVESEPDRTDWLTAVSNLRQINRQLVEEIARLEQALATTTQSLHNHKEQNQSHEITILQHQDDLRIAQDRLGGMFQQLETSHQIGQRQQTLVETLSQQLEIVQTIVPQLESEHDELTQKYQQQSHRLHQTEQVVIELHRQLQLHATDSTTATDLAQIEIDPILAEILNPTSILQGRGFANDNTSISTSIDTTNTIDIPTPNPATPAELPLTDSISTSTTSSSKIDPAPPRSPLQLAQEEIARWTPSAPTDPTKPIISPANWREEFAGNVDNLYRPKLDSISTLTPQSAEIPDKESTDINEDTSNWPAPTLNRDLTAVKSLKIDLPKFPKKSG